MKSNRRHTMDRGSQKNRWKVIMLSMVIAMMNTVSYAQDNVYKLSPEQLIEIVRLYHPVARQAGLQIERAKAEVLIARANFDPLFSKKVSEKTFDGTEYYTHRNTELSIPTWFGVEINAGIESLQGIRTDPTESIGRTSYLGVIVPLAKNLVMDKRRAALQAAKLFRQASEVERKNTLNSLLLDAMKSYWYWMQYHSIYQILDEAVLVNEKRFALLRAGYILGDRPAIDTIEALAQLQSFEVMREDARARLQNAGVALSEFLWTPEDKPVDLPPDVKPADDPAIWNISNEKLPILEGFIASALNNHPELILYKYQLNALNIERKLAVQGLLPAVNFKYNQLGKGYDFLKTTSAPLLENNYQFGLGLSIPLRLSEGRGEYKKVKLIISETLLDQNLKRLQIENKVKAYYNELVALKKQVAIQEQTFNNYVRLQRAEEIRFEAGESSLFLINSRENKKLEAMQKLQELRTKYLITFNSLQWAAGLLVN